MKIELLQICQIYEYFSIQECREKCTKEYNSKQKNRVKRTENKNDDKWMISIKCPSVSQIQNDLTDD